MKQERGMLHSASLRLFTCLVALTSLTVTGCSSGTAEDDAPWRLGPYDNWIAWYITSAIEHHASDHQLELLQRALEEREVSFEDASTGAHNAVACMTEYGIDASFETFESSFGTSIPGYVITAPDDQALDESRGYIDECEMREFHWVNRAFQLQPNARDALGAYVLSKEGALRECLESHGELTDPQSNGWELAQQAQALLRDGMNSSNGAPVTDCLTATGIDSL